MSNRSANSGPKAGATGFVAIAQTVLAPGVNVVATGYAAQFVSHHKGPIVTRMDPRALSVNDIVTASPRTAPLSTSQVGFSHARIVSVGSGPTASAIVELAFLNPNTSAATLVANTWNIAVQLQGADL